MPSANPIATLTRAVELPDRTLGELRVYKSGELALKLFTLELPWVDKDADGVSDRSVSRIPPGQYDVTPWNSARFPGTWRLTDPPGRSAILIHAGNYPRHTEGCILIGLDRADLDRDGRPDLGRSKPALAALRSVVGKGLWHLTVQDPGMEPPAKETPAAREALRYIEPVDELPPSVPDYGSLGWFESFKAAVRRTVSLPPFSRASR